MTTLLFTVGVHKGVLESQNIATNALFLGDMVKTFNESLETGMIPEEWLHSYLLPIPKPGKDHTALSGFRIITMQNTFGKILEKVVAKRVTAHLEDKKLLPDGLGSYRPGRETCVNTATLAYDVYEGFQSKEESY